LGEKAEDGPSARLRAPTAETAGGESRLSQELALAGRLRPDLRRHFARESANTLPNSLSDAISNLTEIRPQADVALTLPYADLRRVEGRNAQRRAAGGGLEDLISWAG
jgi:hypothetical protein